MSVRPVVQVIQTRATASVSQPRSVVVKVPGPQGPTGAQGPQGVKGDTGDSALTFAVGTVTTGAAGSSASVTDVGSDGDVILDFTIPRGDLGVEVDEGSGISDGDILVYDANWDVWVPQAMYPSNSIVQVLYGTNASAVTDTTGNWTDANVSVTINPKLSSSKILLSWTMTRTSDSGTGLERTAFSQIVDETDTQISTAGGSFTSYNDGPDERTYSLSQTVVGVYENTSGSQKTFRGQIVVGSVSSGSILVVTEIAE